MNRLTPILATTALLASASTFAADHLDGPLVSDDRTADINDVYAFINPNDPGELILAATVFPLAGSSSQFSDAVEYRFNIESSAAPLTAGTDHQVNCRAMGKRKLQSMRCSLAGTDTVAGQLNLINVNDTQDLRLFAGLRDDPFFFDLIAFQEPLAGSGDGFTDPGEDFFAPLNTLAIVVGIELGLVTANGSEPYLAVYGSTHRSDGGPLKGSAENGASNTMQIDRMGRAAVNTALIDPYSLTTDPALKDVYNTSESRADWSAFVPEIQANLEFFDSLDGAMNTAIPPAALAPLLADDRLLVDTQFATCDSYLSVELTLLGVFLNQCGGRALAHDVIDDTFALVIGSPVSDNVGNDDNADLNVFPFVGDPQ
ncbi:MAG: DUF4331 family protein [Xanthomonadales bacterium]|nr:DUF4331 family protein [Xanthomonadales bacterium]